MNSENFSPQNFERFMRESAPTLKELLNQEEELSPERMANLKKLLEAHRPFLRMLANEQMQQVILQLLKTRPMDASELAGLLRKNNVKLKGASGEGELFGLLRELENAKLIEGEWKDGGTRRREIYKLTDLGRAEIQPVTSKEAELAYWLLNRVSG